jgi:AraC family transcriptional regulator
MCAKSLADVMPRVNVLWSSGVTWHGAKAEAYHFEDVVTPHFQTADHCVLIHLSTPALIELEADGQRDTRTRVRGDLAILPGTAVCRVRSHEPHETLVLTVSQERVAQTALEAGSGIPYQLIARPYHRDTPVEHICWALEAEAQCYCVSGPLYGESLAVALCVHLLRQGSAEPPATARKASITPRTLRRVVDYIKSNLDGPLPLSSLATISGLSQYRFRSSL